MLPKLEHPDENFSYRAGGWRQESEPHLYWETQGNLEWRMLRMNR